MVAVLVIVIILFAIGILGAVVKGLLWLTFVCIVAAVVAIGYGYWKRRDAAGS